MTNSQQKELLEAMFKIEGDKVEVQQMGLIHLLQEMGFGICRDEKSPYNNQLILNNSNVIEVFNERNLANMLVSLMREHKLDPKLIEKFVRGSGGYLALNKLQFLNSTNVNILKDTREETYLPFMNCLVKVSKFGCQIIDYKDIEGQILSDTRIKRDFNRLETSDGCNFKEFCRMITGRNELRFKSLQSILGYLLHTNKEAQENKIVLLYDAEIGSKTSANGGTGKTLLINGAIKQLRNVVIVDGKRYDDRSNRFLYQNVNPSTNIVLFDDVNDKFKLEDIFSVSTGDFEVEKKGKQSFVLDYKYAPKFVVSSNREVKMIAGSSSERRKIELVLDNVFNAEHTPKDYFNEIFFSDDWDEDTFNNFFDFMFECIAFYHKNGIMKGTTEELLNQRLIGLIGKDSFEMIQDIEKHFNDEWLEKREVLEFLKEISTTDITSHQMTKDIKRYCNYKGIDYNEKNSGSVLKFKLCDSKLISNNRVVSNGVLVKNIQKGAPNE